jgi:hypothetical protein
VGEPAVQLEPAPHGAKGRASIMRRERDPKICDRGQDREARNRLLGPCPAAIRIDWRPTSPPNIRGAPKGAPPTSSAPCSSPEPTGRRASSNLIGRVREPMCFWDTEQKSETKEGDALEANAEELGRRHGTLLPIDNRGPDRCWAATLIIRYLALAYATRRFLRRPNSVA